MRVALAGDDRPALIMRARYVGRRIEAGREAGGPPTSALKRRLASAQVLPSRVRMVRSQLDGSEAAALGQMPRQLSG